MFNPRQYGIAQGSLIAKSIHQEDLQCNESSVKGRRKALPPKIASATPKAFSPGRGGRGGWRGGKGFVRGRGGNFASSRIFQKSLPPPPNSSSPSFSSTPNGANSSAVSGITHNASSSHPRGSQPFPRQPQSWKGRAVMPIPKDENPRPAKRRRMDNLFPAFMRSLGQGSHVPPGDHTRLSTRPTSVEDIISTPVTPSVNSLITPPHNLQQSLPRTSISNTKLADQRDGNLGSSQRIFQQRSNRLPPHIRNTVAPIVNNEPSTTPPWLPRATKRKWDFFQNEQSKPAEILADAAPTVLFSTKTPSSRISVANSALPPADKAAPSFRPPWTPTAVADGSKRPQSFSNILLDYTRESAPHTFTTDASSPHALYATPRSLPRPSLAPKAMISTYEGSRRPLPKSTESFDVQQILSALTSHVKKESPPSVENPALPLAGKAAPPFQPPWAPTTIAEGSKRPQSSSNILFNDTKEPAPCTSSTDPSSSHALNATSESLSRPSLAPKAMIPTHEGRKRPLPKSTESSDVQQIPSALTSHVKKESPPSFPVPKKSPVPSPAVQVKSENMDSFLTEEHRVPVEVKDPIVIKQEPDFSESIIPRRKLVTESCSFYPIPQNCRKSVPNYKNNRIEYFRKEYKRLREFGLTKQKVVFRDDGLAIEWTSSIPVWSDTLLPEASGSKILD